MLELKNLSIGYDNRVLVRDISAKYDQGQLVCLTGDNGSGKTTLLKTIAGLLPPLGGEVIVTPSISGGLGLVLTARPSTPNLTSREVVSMGRAPYTGIFGSLSKDDKRIIEESIASIGIKHLADKMIGCLSDGEVQKVMIAKCLAQQTPIILMDEPTAFLDYKSKRQLYQLMRHLVDEEQKLIIFSSHDLPLALEYATDEQSL